MSLSRDEMAVRLLAGILANPAFVNESGAVGSIHTAAVWHADQLLAELARAKPAVTPDPYAGSRYGELWAKGDPLALWIATDEDGEVWMFSCKPTPGVNSPQWIPERGTWHERVPHDARKTMWRCPDWRDSLEARPTSRE